MCSLEDRSISPDGNFEEKTGKPAEKRHYYTTETSTKWINSLAGLRKASGKLWTCTDPKPQSIENRFIPITNS